MDEFSAENYDPKQWAKLAKEAGMKYAVLTAKHHDGFCLFDSKLTDFKSTNAPCKRDLVREFLEAFRPAQVHIFPYSRREGTRAADRPGQLTRAQKEQRAKRADELCRRLRSEYMSGFAGREVSVLFEQEEDGISHGYSMEYLPVRVKEKGLSGQIRTVRIENNDENTLTGVII